MSAFHDNALMGASGQQGYQISRSVRLRSSASAYLSETFGTPTNNKIWTWSGWVKRSNIGSNGQLFAHYTSDTQNNYFQFSGDVLRFSFDNGTVYAIATSAVFRDPSAWYHVVIAVDTTQATAANRTKLYVNGVEQTVTGSYVPQNTNTYLNGSGRGVTIGRRSAAADQYLDGYITEINFIDGQALTPSSFGETDALTGVWKPKKYAGTYGTNGFYLNFSDNSSNTATTIGKDYSGNGNNWTPNNISVTAGVTYDSMLDVPTLYADGGNGRGNYAVLNPLDKTSASPTYSNGNLGISAGASWAYSRATMLLPPNVKIYAETILGSNTTGTSAIQSGFARDGFAMGTNGYYVNHDSVGQIYTAGSLTASGLGALVAGDVIQFAYDGAGNAWIGKNNVWWNSSGGTTGNPSTGANPTFTGLSAYNLFISTGNYSNSQNINFGQRPFTYTPPTGFVALNTQNLDDSTIKKGNQYFDVNTRTGTAASFSVTGKAFQPDLVWSKSRNNAYSNMLIDSSRGVGKWLQSDTTSAEGSDVTGLTSFNADGFSGGAQTAFNGSGSTMVDWLWKKGATQGVDIVTYTGDGTTNRTVAHSLGVQPSMFIIKARSAATTSWMVHHKDLGNNGGSPAYLQYLQLESTAAKAASTSLLPVVGLSSTTFPTSGATNNTNVNGNGTTYVAYLFSEVLGFSKFGSYTGNGAADGVFVYCGFRPKFIMIKGSSFVSNWFIQDGVRNGYNVNSGVALRPNLSNAEDGTNFYDIDILSNGFKLRTSTADANSNGATFIFAAFAENPFKNSLAR